MKIIKKCAKVSGMVALFLVVMLLCSMFFSYNMLSRSVYEYQNEKLTAGIKAVQLTDLHNRQFGKNNRRLIKKVRKEQPDVIFLTGDMLNDSENRTDIVEKLIRALCEIAPVYVSFGNHEIAYMEVKEQEHADLVQLMEQAGAVVLEQEYIDTEINGQEVRIGGLYGYVLAEDWEDGSEQRFMERFEDTDRFKILLSHMPDGLITWKSMEHWKVDLVFSGHLHGGQIRIPFVGGLYGPEVGYFPEYTKGMYECGYGTMILSAGLGSSGMVPRIHNLPEIVICEMTGDLPADGRRKRAEMAYD